MPDPVHIDTRIDPDTLRLPELRPFFGKSVESTVREDAPPARKPDWTLLRRLGEPSFIPAATERIYDPPDRTWGGHIA